MTPFSVGKSTATTAAPRIVGVRRPGGPIFSFVPASLVFEQSQQFRLVPRFPFLVS
jgi:hypothetical protein